MKTVLGSLLQMLLIVSVLSSGCSDSDSQTGPKDAGPDSSEIDLADESEQETAKPEEGVPFKIYREADDVDGYWLFYVKSESNEIPIGQIGFRPVSGTEPPRYEADFRPTQQAESINIASWNVQPESVEVTFTNGPQVKLFQGQLRDGIVFGNLVSSDGVCTPARLIRPDLKEGELLEPVPHLAEGIHDFSEVMKQGAAWDELVTFIEDHPESPLLPNAFYTVFLQARPREIPAEKIEEMFELVDRTMIPWGERLKNYVRLNSLLQLSTDYRHPDLLESVYTSLEGKFEEPVWKPQADFFMTILKKDIELARKVDSLREADEQQRSEILKQLQQEAEASRFNHKLFVSTAEALADVEDRQGAVDWYLKLIVVPGLENRYMGQFERFSGELPPPSSQLNKLWKETHGTEEGLQELLDTEYQKMLSRYELPEFELPEPTGKQVLIELFTGAACRPCIAADLALTVLHDRLPGDRVTMLQYHMHIPAPDPLACPESAGRFNYYGNKGTPTAIVNGRVFESLAGDARFVSNVLQQLINEILEESSLAPRMQIDLKVKPADDGTAAFDVSVKADEISDRWRLHVALAEGEVKYKGASGVPVHEMVVRKLYTSSQGLPPSGGSLTLSGTIDPEQIRKDLKQSLANLREKNSVDVEDGPFDLDDLFLVAFVQDVRSRRVRQVVSVPVPLPSKVASDPE